MLEIKRNLAKPDEHFDCEALQVTPSHAVLRYVTDRDWLVGNTLIPAGSVTVAHYRTDQEYVVWRMIDPGGQLLGHLIHVAREIEVSATSVVWTDLLLDVWIGADGEVLTLDEDELDERVAEGKLTGVMGRQIREIGEHVRNNWRQIAS